MSVASYFSRLTEYYRRHGLRATISRARIAAQRSFFQGRMIVFYCDLCDRGLRPVSIPKTFAVKRVDALEELRPEHFREITSFWNPKLAEQNVRERFEKGASLWLVEAEDLIAGYGWTLRGQAIEPYYFPLGPDDVQLFDFYVFPKFRGRALHWLLTGHILHTLRGEGASRAFADTGEWNQAQLASFKMTAFRTLGFVRTYKVFGHLLTSWTFNTPPDTARTVAPRRPTAVETLRPNG